MPPDDVGDWLEQAGRLFASLSRGKGLRIIVAPADDAGLVRGVELRAGPGADFPSGQVVGIEEESGPARPIRADDLSDSQAEDVATVRVGPVRGLPLVEPVELKEAEAEVLEALVNARRKLQAKELAPKLSRANDSKLRGLLSRMRRQRKLIDNTASLGYFPTLLGLISLQASKDNDLFSLPPR
jgi:hypothetical protein